MIRALEASARSLEEVDESNRKCNVGHRVEDVDGSVEREDLRESGKDFYLQPANT